MKEPNVTIVLPVLNEAHSIPALLDALWKQDFPAERTEVLFVDGGSADGTKALIQEARHRFHNLRLIENPKRTAAAGLNIGIAAAKGDIIIRMDGHALIASHHVSRSVELLTRHNADCVGGPIDVQGKSAIGRAQGALMKTWMGTGGALFRCGTKEPTYTDTVFCGAWWRRHFEVVGTFDESLPCNQDDEFHFRTRAAGGRILLDPSLIATWFPRETLLGLAVQYGRYGFHKVSVLRRHPSCRRMRQFLPSVFVAALFLSLTVGGGGSALLLLLIHGAASLVSAASMGLLHDLPALWAAPLVALTQHIAYGSGFLAASVLAFFTKKAPKWSTHEEEATRIKSSFEAKDTAPNTHSISKGEAALSEGRWKAFLQHARPSIAGSPHDWRILDIGCGNGGWMHDFIEMGVPERNLCGIDLSARRTATTQAAFPKATVQVADGSRLPFDDDSMDIVILSTVFSSVHLASMRESIATEALRVLKPNGVIVGYDARLPNPLNQNLHPLNAGDWKRLFQGHEITTHRCTLLPPLTRILAPFWMGAAKFLTSVPALRSHLIVVVQPAKGTTDAKPSKMRIAHV